MWVIQIVPSIKRAHIFKEGHQENLTANRRKGSVESKIQNINKDSKVGI